MPDVILVNEFDSEVGTMEKISAHKEGLLHRAFSVFIFDNQGKMLLQKRHRDKYHNGGMWSNACCSHPYPGEATLTAAHRRLQEELGFETSLTKVFDFIYKVGFPNGLYEHEYDHVFVGRYDGQISMHPAEVEDFAYLEMENIESHIHTESSQFTEWFRIAFPKIKEHWALMFKCEPNFD